MIRKIVMLYEEKCEAGIIKEDDGRRALNSIFKKKIKTANKTFSTRQI
jgi:hypothetical protein